MTQINGVALSLLEIFLIAESFGGVERDKPRNNLSTLEKLRKLIRRKSVTQVYNGRRNWFNPIRGLLGFNSTRS